MSIPTLNKVVAAYSGAINRKTLPGIFMVSGTSIGGGMIAQPIAAIQHGFWPQAMMLCIVWIAMTWSALLLAKICVLHPGDSLLSLASNTLGPWAKIIVCVIYIFMAIGSCAAYISHSGEILTSMLPALSKTKWSLVFACLFSGVLAFEAATEKINSLLFFILVFCYGCVLFQNKNLVWIGSGSNWHGCDNLIPLLFTSFSFHMIVPRLVIFLNGSLKQTSKAIILGTTLSLVCYLIWNAALLGQIDGVSLAPSFALSGLGFCAVATSFLGIIWGFKHFIQDGMAKIWGNDRSHFSLVSAVFPCVLLAQKPDAFLSYLELTGGIGDSILSGIFPLAMLCVAVKKEIISRLHPIAWMGFGILTLFFTLVFIKTVKDALI